MKGVKIRDPQRSETRCHFCDQLAKEYLRADSIRGGFSSIAFCKKHWVNFQSEVVNHGKD